jgi:hypothetical protein
MLIKVIPQEIPAFSGDFKHFLLYAIFLRYGNWTLDNNTYLDESKIELSTLTNE